MSRQGALEDERGFTLIEVMVTIILMLIVFGIASSTWIKVAESRRVDSATNQVVADLRLAHTRATNRLEYWRIEMDADTRNYRMGLDGGALSSDSLPDHTEFPPTSGLSAIVFKPNGGAQITGAGNIRIAADDGSPCHEIAVNSVTSRVKVSRNAC
jgi:prepilin-type N-terminal cleavage/methylation domain-containing protein